MDSLPTELTIGPITVSPPVVLAPIAFLSGCLHVWPHVVELLEAHCYQRETVTAHLPLEAAQLSLRQLADMRVHGDAMGSPSTEAHRAPLDLLHLPASQPGRLAQYIRAVGEPRFQSILDNATA